jgi:hypothetical protein
MNIAEYEKARDLLEQIERQQLEVESRLRVIDELKVELNTSLQKAGARLRESFSAGPVATSPALSVGTRSTMPTPTASRAGKAATKRGAPVNGEKGHPQPGGRVTLGDMVRDILIDAGKPLKHTEIRDALKARNYTNSAPDQFKTLGVRLHRLQKRGVRNIGKGYFDLTEEWKTQLEHQGKASTKQLSKEEAKLSKA